VLDRERLTRLLVPLAFVFASWVVLAFAHDPIERYLMDAAVAAEGIEDATWDRHKSPLYWLDSDWIKAFFALGGLAAFDLVNRRERNALYLPAFAAAGAGFGWLSQTVLESAGVAGDLGRALTRPLGAPGAVVASIGRPADAADFLTNWPQFFGDFPQHLGWGLGLLAGVVVYFVRYGRWREGASLYVHMAVGWFACFLALPVLGGLLLRDAGGLSMTPPRSDDWAGISGVFAGATIWFLRNGLGWVSLASVVSGFLGGFAFSFAQLLKLVFLWPGSGYRMATAEQAALAAASPAELRAAEGAVHAAAARWLAENPAWAHWQQQNWHSVLEQTYGFFNGLAIVVALAFLATRLRPQADGPRVRPWSEPVALAFVLVLLPYLNLVKNVRVWTEGARPLMDDPMQAPLIGAEWANLSATGWFRFAFMLLALALLALCAVHRRRPIPLLGVSPLVRGQLLYLAFLWPIVAGNFERALPGFRAQRLVTEGVIFANAVLASALLLAALPARACAPPEEDEPAPGRLLRRACLLGLVLSVLVVALETASVRLLYGDLWSGHSGYHHRFGPAADWRVKPNLKSGKHR
jgi:hypothetical protein